MTQKQQDSEAYKQKRKFFDKLLTIYGRKPVQEALQQPGIEIHRLHLADSNKPAAVLDDIIRIAEQQGAEICYHSKQALSRISKNAKQDQGIAVDLILHGYQQADDFLQNLPSQFELIALDGITNPQNLGMIIRSVAASGIAGLLLPTKGGAQIDPLVIKASAGALFRCPIIRCDNLSETLEQFKTKGAQICALSSHAHMSVKDFNPQGAAIYVMGNETNGVSEEIGKLCNQHLKIPMSNGVESLNVAVTASLLAFRSQL
ncbi:RNA methyltransferase [Simiduia curdlanivorans]|uniref:TrmH family RNA methyltransferase n=1 Tax=Simiduia curdlanivorans TaxID=1492769 RepID=A0ABV8VAW0_9GAMM|nr:RNA methyltransferase [Simiduia curdlanivorans]MDN3639463.1 RNA methyltransferase [Simiduia curdlanivorans]